MMSVRSDRLSQVATAVFNWPYVAIAIEAPLSGPISPALREAGPEWDYRQMVLM